MTDALTVQWLDVTVTTERSASFRDGFKQAVDGARSVTAVVDDDGRARHVDVLFAGFSAGLWPLVLRQRLLERRVQGLHSTVGELVLLCYGRALPMPKEEDVVELALDQAPTLAPQMDSRRHETEPALRDWCLEKILNMARQRDVAFQPDPGGSTESSSVVNRI